VQRCRLKTSSGSIWQYISRELKGVSAETRLLLPRERTETILVNEKLLAQHTLVINPLHVNVHGRRR